MRGERIRQPEARVVARRRVFRAWIAQTDDGAQS